MWAAAPAPVSTTTSRPRLLNFLTVSGVAATRVSPLAVSLGTASFIPSSPRPLPVGPEDGQEDHHQEDEDQRVFDEGEEPRIAALMRADIHRAGDVVLFFAAGHETGFT